MRECLPQASPIGLRPRPMGNGLCKASCLLRRKASRHHPLRQCPSLRVRDRVPNVWRQATPLRCQELVHVNEVRDERHGCELPSSRYTRVHDVRVFRRAACSNALTVLLQVRLLRAQTPIYNVLLQMRLLPVQTPTWVHGCLRESHLKHAVCLHCPLNQACIV